MSTIFHKILSRDIPADIVFEDEEMLAFRDISPVSPTHILLIPKNYIANLDRVEEIDSDLLGRMIYRLTKIAKAEGISDNGYRVVVNCGEDGGQEVPYLHLHLLGGRKHKWPPG